MQRTKFLQLAQRVSCLSDGARYIKNNVPKNMQVVFDDICYYPIGYEMKFKNGEVIHSAILHELNCDVVVYAALDKVGGFFNET